MLLARVFVTSGFLYRGEYAQPGTKATPVSDFELANRLSYFLWSSLPDQELGDLAAAGTLHQPEVLRAQTQRMMADPKTRRMAIEFGCQWLHIRDFDQLDEKSEQHYPEFKELRGAMYEEAIRFFEDMFRNDGSVLNLLNADYTFVNAQLAQFYGIVGLEGDGWQRVNGTKGVSRGGILTMAATLSKQSGASRTSPILRQLGVRISAWRKAATTSQRRSGPARRCPGRSDRTPAHGTSQQRSGVREVSSADRHLWVLSGKVRYDRSSPC